MVVDKFYEGIDRSYRELLERKDRRVLVHYAGDLNFGFANALTARIEKVLSNEVRNKKVQRRFFSVFVEAIQNIRLHGVSDDERRIHAGVTIFLSENQLCSVFSNLIPTKAIAKLESRYEEVNNMDSRQLKEKYMHVMMNGGLSEKGGAGLGIITIVMRSRNPGPYKIVPIDDEMASFEFQTCVDLE